MEIALAYELAIPHCNNPPKHLVEENITVVSIFEMPQCNDLEIRQ